MANLDKNTDRATEDKATASLDTKNSVMNTALAATEEAQSDSSRVVKSTVAEVGVDMVVNPGVMDNKTSSAEVIGTARAARMRVDMGNVRNTRNNDMEMMATMKAIEQRKCSLDNDQIMTEHNHACTWLPIGSGRPSRIYSHPLNVHLWAFSPWMFAR